MTLRAVLLGGFRQALRIYFRRVNVSGEVPADSVRGRLFAPNHVNGLVDPLLVLTTADCVVSPIGKAPLWKIPILGLLLDAVGAVPVVRRRDDPTKAGAANDAIFEQVGGHLKTGGNVLIFPEGTSHNEPHLVKIRTGPARMLMRAFAEGASDVTFQGVGLEFEARDTFRSRVLVLYGPVRKVASLEAIKNGARGEDAVQAVTRALEADLASLVVSGETWDERRLISRVAELLDADAGADSNRAPHQGGSIERWSELARAVRDSGRQLAKVSPEAIDPVRAAVDAYYVALDRDGLSDRDVRTSGDRPIRAGRIGPVTMWLVAPLALLGAMLYYLPYRLPRFVAGRAREADVVSTLKLAVGIVVFPIWAALLTVLALATVPFPLGLGLVLLVWASPLPALWWLDAFEDGLLRPRKTAAALRVLRSEAVRAIENAKEQATSLSEQSA